MQLPEVCDYHDAKYLILIFHDNGSLAYRSMEETYDKDGPDNIEVEVSENLLYLILLKSMSQRQLIGLQLNFYLVNKIL